MNLDLWDLWNVEARQKFPQVYPVQRGIWTTSVESQGLAKVSYIYLCAPAHSEQPTNVERWH